MRNSYPRCRPNACMIGIAPARDIDDDRPIPQPGHGAEEFGFCRVGKGNERELHSVTSPTWKSVSEQEHCRKSGGVTAPIDDMRRLA